MTPPDSSETDWGQCAKNAFDSLLLLKLNIEIEPLQQLYGKPSIYLYDISLMLHPN